MVDFQRIARSLCWFGLGVLIAFVWLVPSAYAETIAATATGGTVASHWALETKAGISYATEEAACAPNESNCWGSGATRTGFVAVSGQPNQAYCEWTKTSTGSLCHAYKVQLVPDGTCAGGIVYTGSTLDGTRAATCPSSATYTCPSTGGWTLSGTNCTRSDCPSGQIHDDSGACVNDCTAGVASTATRYTGQFSGCGASAVGTCTKPSVGNLTPAPDTLCDGSCVMTRDASAGCHSVIGIAGAPIECSYSGVRTGATCSGGNGAAPTYDPCFGEGKVSGTIDGVPVCGGEAAKSTESTKTTTTPTSTTVTKTTTYCDSDGNCTTTTSSTYTSGGSGPNGTGAGSTTTSGTGPGSDPTPKVEKEDKPSFCEENPESPICKQTSFSGACAPGATAPACDGDAVQCAQAAEAWKINCALHTEPTDAPYELGKSISGGGADPVKSPLDPSLVTEVDVAGLVSGAASVRTLTASCIPNQTFTVGGHSYTFDTSKFCEFAGIIGYLMVAASSVIAIRMVVAGGSV